VVVERRHPAGDYHAHRLLCVMVLATPTALVASIGNAALRGSLIKKGATVEALAKVNTVVFDKTGTLTLGEPRLIELLPLNGTLKTNLLHLAAVAEKFSEHPLARAIGQAADTERLVVPDPDAFETLPGLGVRARTDGRVVIVGRPQLLSEHGVPVSADTAAQVATLAAPGRSVVAVATEGQLAGFLMFEDTVRPAAKPTVTRLQQLGLRTVLVTGDHRAAAERIAAALGIEEVHAEVLPRQKVELVRRLQAEGRRVRRRRRKRRPGSGRRRCRGRHGAERDGCRHRDRGGGAAVRRPFEVAPPAQPLAAGDPRHPSKSDLFPRGPRHRGGVHDPWDPHARDRCPSPRTLVDSGNRQLCPADPAAGDIAEL